MSIKRDKKTKAFTLSNIKHLIEVKKLNFDPKYQRNFIWKKSQKQLFIDSIMIDYDVPKIYFHDNNDKYDVVDGQQRLLTIHEFINDQFPVYTHADPIKGHETANKNFSDLHIDIQMEFNNQNLDIVILSGYSDDEIEDMFLRYQNGEPLNAAEKRRGLHGNFKNIITELARHKIFEKCYFDNRRFQYEDAVAKILHTRFHGSFVSISTSAIEKTYLNNKDIHEKNKHVRAVTKTLNYISNAYKKISSPNFKKFQILTYTELLYRMNENFAILKRGAEIADTLQEFEIARLKNNELPEKDQDQTLNNFNDAARGDSPAVQEFRYTTLLKYILNKIRDIETKDSKRSFTEGQRMVIYDIYDGACNICNKELSYDEFEADHIISHAKGGKTEIDNGQLLCIPCNRKKGSK